MPEPFNEIRSRLGQRIGLAIFSFKPPVRSSEVSSSSRVFVSSAKFFRDLDVELQAWIV